MAAARGMRAPWSKPTRPHTAGAAFQKEDTETGTTTSFLPQAFQRGNGRPVSSSAFLPPHAAPVPSRNLMIEGLQTGQVVTVEPIPRRLPDPDNRRVADLEAKVRRLTDALERERKERVKDQALIKKLQEEIQRLNNALRERDQEVLAMNTVIVDLRGQLAGQGRDQQGRILKLEDELQAAREDSQLAAAKVPILKQEAEDWRSKWEAEHEMAVRSQQELAISVERLQQQIASLRKELEGAQRQSGQFSSLKRQAERQLADTIDQLQKEVEAREAKVQDLEAEMMRRGKLGEQQAEDLQWHKDQTSKYNKYLQRICQPQFSVVKDHSLTPVEPNGFEVVEGHVLVPLQLLLEGYAMLPETMRQVYNQSDYCPPTPASLLKRPVSSTGTRK